MWRLLLPFGLFVAAMVVTQAILASKLHRLSAQRISRFRCFRMLSPPVMRYPVSASRRDPFNPYAYEAPLAWGETKEFRERLITYRAIILGIGFLLMPLMVGLLMYLTRNLNP